MSKFPEAIPLHRKVVLSRLQRRKELILTARRGVFLRGVIILVEIGGFALWGSSALFLDALASSMDIMASLVLIWCIRLADRPPDEDHPMGHGRFEPIAGLLVGFLMVFLGALSSFDQIKEMVTGGAVHSIDPVAWVIPLFALVVLEFCHQTLKKTAKRKNSPALMADAVHYRIDALTSCFALIALCMAAIYPAKAHFFDHIGAVFIALFMIVVGLIAARKNIHQLLDRSPPSADYEKVREAALSVEGVRATEKLKLQIYGPDAHVAIDIEVHPELTVAASHAITQRVRRAIQLEIPQVRDVIVHVEPHYPGDHES